MIEIRNLNKIYEKFQIRNLNLHVERGEFLSVLGQSGSGKSTLLNLISGSDREYTGEIKIHGEPLQVAIKNGKLSMVFQDSLLLPHLNVYENIAFGLKIRKIPRDEIERRVREVMDRLELKDLEKRFPSQLSGGQRQRVSIGRALVMRPSLLLMDEPFSALDTKLREKLQKMMKELQKEMELTVIFVTHDRDEAFYLSDRIALMNRGRIIQLDTPGKLYNNPENIYVAKFLGIENIFTGQEFSLLTDKKIYEGKILAIPSEDLRVVLEDGNIQGKVEEIIFKTGFYNIVVKSGNQEIKIKQNRIDFPLQLGDKVWIKFREKDIIFIEGEENA
ncbi:MAG: ABC transporter ATP-binding protein [Fusobacteriaceae bacterium]